jgi:hypothetical protein
LWWRFEVFYELIAVAGLLAEAAYAFHGLHLLLTGHTGEPVMRMLSRT